MDLEVLLLADYANVAEGGKLNVMGIFNRISCSNFPARHPEMTLVMKLAASPAEYNTIRKLTVKLLDEDATQEVVNWSGDIRVPQDQRGRKVTINQILKLRGVIFPHPGNYQFYVLVDQDQKGTLPLFLVKQEPAEP